MIVRVFIKLDYDEPLKSPKQSDIASNWSLGTTEETVYELKNRLRELEPKFG